MSGNDMPLWSDPAETALLGLVSRYGDGIADTVERLPGSDFYSMPRGVVWDACRALIADREPTDPVTVSRWLMAHDKWSSNTLNGDVQNVVQVEMLRYGTDANIAFAERYADQIIEYAARRRLIATTVRIKQLATERPSDTSSVLAEIRAELDAVEDPGTEATSPLGFPDGPLGWSDLISEFEAFHTTAGDTVGISSPWPAFDHITAGFHPGRMYVFGGRPATGKALAVDTPIPTPQGWAAMGDLQVGQQVFGSDGKPVTVTGAFEVRSDRDCFEVEFSDGSTIVADADHLWLTETRAARKSAQGLEGRSETRGRSPFARDQRHLAIGPEVVTTLTIRETLMANTADKRFNHSVKVAGALALPSADLPVAPYTLGIWLGDGTSAASSYTSADPEIAAYIEEEGYRVVDLPTALRYSIKLPARPAEPRPCLNCGTLFVPYHNRVQACSRSCGSQARHRGLVRNSGPCRTCGEPTYGVTGCQTCRATRGTFLALVRNAGVLNDKHVPHVYLRASEGQRRALLAGLLDSDGYAGRAGVVQFAVTNERLARGVLELVATLGYQPTMATKAVKGRRPESSVSYIVSFTTADDVFRLKRKRLAHEERSQHVGVRPTRRYITGVRAVPSVPVRCIQVDSADHLYLAGRTMIPTHNTTAALIVAMHCAAQEKRPALVISKEMSRVDVTGRFISRLADVPVADINARRMTQSHWANVYDHLKFSGEPPITVDATPRTLAGVKRLARAHQHRHGLDLLVVDYLQLVRADTPGRSREQEVAEVSRELKQLALELDIVVVLPAQLNREVTKRADPRPMVSDLRDSGQIEQDADVIILLHRTMNAIGEYTGDIEFIIGKNRHGQTASVTLQWRGGYASIC